MPTDFDRVIDRMSSNSEKWHTYAPDVLPLWVADMDFESPPAVLKVMHSMLEHGVFGYEYPTAELQEVVAERMRRLYGWDVSGEMVVSIPGVQSGFLLSARLSCLPDKGLLVQPPVYGPFLQVHKKLGIPHQASRLVHVNQGERLSYEIDFDDFESAVHGGGTRTGMFLLCNPHNPTGQVYTKDQVKRLAEICLRKGVLICSDEIHSELLLGGARHTPIASLSPEIARHSITLVAPSKTFNLAGLYSAFAIIPDPDLCRAYRREAENLTMHVNSLGLAAARVAFSGMCDEWLAELNCYLSANRDFLVTWLARNLPEARCTLPQATYLGWLDFNDFVRDGSMPDSPYRFFLEKARVGLSDGTTFGEGGEGFVRLNFGCPRSTMLAALEQMKSALENPA